MAIFQGEFFLLDCMAFMRNDLTIRSFSYAKNNILQILNIFWVHEACNWKQTTAAMTLVENNVGDGSLCKNLLYLVEGINLW